MAYNQLIRPWKSRLGLIYIEHQSVILDIQLIVFTVVAIASRTKALGWVANTLIRLGVSKEVVAVSWRSSELYPYPPPGSNAIVCDR